MYCFIVWDGIRVFIQNCFASKCVSARSIRLDLDNVTFQVQYSERYTRIYGNFEFQIFGASRFVSRAHACIVFYTVYACR